MDDVGALCMGLLWHFPQWVCRRYHVSKRRIIPLPMYKIDPVMHPEGLFKPKQVLSCVGWIYLFLFVVC